MLRAQKQGMPIPLWELLASLALGALAVVAAATGFACWYLRRKRLKAGPTPPISLLKPLKGLDDGLWENLLAFCDQDYPQYEILFGAEDPGDPALDLARRLQRARPGVQIRVVACSGQRGRNPKVRVLRGLLPHARHEYVLISDSNTRPGPGYLRATAAELRDPAVQMVTNPVVGIAPGGETPGALLENLHTGVFVNQTAGFIRALTGRACVVGKSMLLSKRALEAVGGLRSVCSVLAEDYLLGRKFELAGFGVALCAFPIPTVVEDWPVQRFFERHLRWGQMRRRLGLLNFFSELLFNPILFLALALLARGPEITPVEATAALTLAVAKLWLDAALLGALRGRALVLQDAAWIPLKDLLVAGLWCVALFKRTLSWRGNELRIGRKSRLFAAPQEPQEAREAA
jgi:ceramide glucosyltransferase